MTTKTTKVAVDLDYCQAHGRCYALFPQLFTADDEGRGVVLGGGAIPDDVDISEVTAACPEAAITEE